MFHALAISMIIVIGTVYDLILNCKFMFEPLSDSFLFILFVFFQFILALTNFQFEIGRKTDSRICETNKWEWNKRRKCKTKLKWGSSICVLCVCVSFCTDSKTHWSDNIKIICLPLASRHTDVAQMLCTRNKAVLVLLIFYIKYFQSVCEKNVYFHYILKCSQIILFFLTTHIFPPSPPSAHFTICGQKT